MAGGDVLSGIKTRISEAAHKLKLFHRRLLFKLNIESYTLWFLYILAAVAIAVGIGGCVTATRNASYRPDYDLAVEYLGRGETRKAMDCLERIGDTDYLDTEYLIDFCTACDWYDEGNISAACHWVDKGSIEHPDKLTPEAQKYIERTRTRIRSDYVVKYVLNTTTTTARTTTADPFAPRTTKYVPKTTRRTESDPYHAADYYSEEDFYDDYYDEFFDYYDAEAYWEEHQ